jgi:hypothetical protein
VGQSTHPRWSDIGGLAQPQTGGNADGGSTYLSTAKIDDPGLPTSTPTATPTASPTRAWVGDCDSSDAVTVDELITLVNIDLGTAAASACPHGIPSGAAVDITLIIKAVGYALTQCPAS